MHTPEPWELKEVASRRYDEAIIQAVDAGPNRRSYVVASGDTIARRNATAARIVACVNALAGLEPEGVAEAVEALEALARADEQPGHVHYMTKARMASVAQSALAALSALGEKP